MRVNKIVLAVFAVVCGIAFTTVAFGTSPTQVQADAQTVDEAKKETYQQKMLVAIDSYQTAKGKYEESFWSYGVTEVEFQVRVTENPRSYVRIVNENGSVHEMRMNGEYMMTKEGDQVISIASVASGNLDPTYGTNSVAFPQPYALGYLEDHSLWKVLGEEPFLDRTAVVAGGMLPARFRTKHHTESFKLWVDKDTGILLKLEEYNPNHQVLERLEVKSLVVDGELEDHLFEIYQQNSTLLKEVM